MSRLPALLLLPLLAAPAAAHPLPNLRFDRTVHVRVAPAGVAVVYTLELNEWTMVLDGNKLLAPADTFTTGREFAALYAKRKAPFLLDNLGVTLAGADVPLAPERTEIEQERDHLRFRFTFRGPWNPPPGTPQPFAFEDRNFDDKTGSMSLFLETDPALAVRDRVEPAHLRDKSPLDLKPGEDVLLRKASAVIELTAAAVPQAAPVPAEPVVVGDSPSLARALFDRGLPALFDTGYGLGVLLLAAGVFGMAHAFTPGHGKALVAAYLIGDRGTVGHALALGLTTTLAHTGSVIAVAVVLGRVYRDGVPDEAQGWLQLAGGVLIAVAGLWLFARRVAGRADHVHLFQDHHHYHGDDGHHHHPPAPAPRGGFGWGRVILLGVGGGLVPCWDAVMLLLVAVTAGRLAFAVPLLLAFSAGLAAVLVLLGVGVVLARRAGAARFGERRWFKLLPVISALLLVGMGFWLCRDGMQRLIAADKAHSQRIG